MTPVTDSRRTVHLYVRADAPLVEHRAAVIDRLEQLDADDRIASYRVHPWPRAISLDLLDLLDRLDGEDVAGLVREFEAWAAAFGCCIRPPFDVRTTYSTFTEETENLLVLPALCLATYDDGDLVGVAPFTDGRSIYTVEDALDALATGATPIPPAPDPMGDSPPDVAGILAELRDERAESPIAANADAPSPGS